MLLSSNSYTVPSGNVITFPTNGSGLNWGNGYSRIVDDNDLQICTDDTLHFRTGSNTSGLGTETMRISSSGNVGINQTNPTYKLDVSGSARITGGIDGMVLGNSGYNVNINPSGGGTTYINDASGDTNINGGAGTTTIGYGTGNVGIGTSIPSYKLDVSGSARIAGGGNDILIDSGNSANLVAINQDSTGYITINDGGGNSYINQSGGTVHINGGSSGTFISYGTGSTLIGNDTGTLTTYPITVTGSYPGITIGGVSNQLNTAPGSGAFSGDALTNDFVIRSYSNNLILQTGSGGSAIYVQTTTNNVGINNASPGFPLEVAGQARFDMPYVSAQVSSDFTISVSDLNKVHIYYNTTTGVINITLPVYPTSGLRYGMTITIKRMTDYNHSSSSFVINNVFNDKYGSGTTTVPLDNIHNTVFRAIYATLPVGSGYGWFDLT